MYQPECNGDLMFRADFIKGDNKHMGLVGGRTDVASRPAAR